MYVYRLLKPDDDPSDGIEADNPAAHFSVFDHVDNGKLKTQYISTCKTYEAVKDFAEKGYNRYNRKRAIVAIDVIKLKQLVPDSLFIDLTHPDVEKEHLRSDPFLGLAEDVRKARNFARKFDEMLIQPGVLKTTVGDNKVSGFWEPCKIPAECMNVIKRVR